MLTSYLNAKHDAWTVLKYLLGFPIAILLTHLSYKDGALHHIQSSTGVHECPVLLHGPKDYFYYYKDECPETKEVSGPNSTEKQTYEDNYLIQINSSSSCKDGMLKKNKQKGEHMNRPCEKHNEGNITYQLGGWKPILDNSVLQVIKHLKRKAKALEVQGIPEIVAELRNATEQFIEELIQSPVTVQTVVGLLVQIAHISQNFTINKPVMENFLKTVDILVSDKSKKTWEKLNNGNVTANTSTELLGAIEDISTHLSDESFTINENSIELIRTVIESSSYSRTSELPNSNTEILIPQLLKPTSLTIIVFTNLDNVLATYNTNNNDSWKSNVHINGDVVVVKVNETLNNISFTFDITNQSLGNPQCVFWNFNLNTWDSTGCEVKPSRNTTGRITCECNHTTSFSILMSPFFIDDKALDYITYTGLGISVVSLVICLIIECIAWNSVSRNDIFYMRHVSIVNIAVSLLIANICFIIGASIVQPGQSAPVGPCTAVAFLMDLFYMALFFWMLISALLLFYRTVMVFSQISRAKMMAIAFIVGYGAPVLIAVTTIASTAGSGKYILEADVCWLNWNETKALQIFVILTLAIVAINLLTFLVVLYKMLRSVDGGPTRPNEKHVLIVIIRSVAILTPIFGLTWGFGIGTMVSPDFSVHVMFTLLNSLQGLFILVCAVLLDSKIRMILATVSLRNLTSRIRNTDGLAIFRRKPKRNVYNISEFGSFSAATEHLQTAPVAQI